MTDTEKFVCKLQECAHNREPITLFGANYVPADDVRLLKMIVAGIEVENVKLQELVKDLVRWYGADHQPYEELRFWGDKNSGVYARMRKLGIEVE